MTHSTPNDELSWPLPGGAGGLAPRARRLGARSQLPGPVGVRSSRPGRWLLSASPVVERPDIAEAFPEIPGADTCRLSAHDRTERQRE